LHTLTELLRDEIQEELGSLPIVRRLAEALFISAVRYYVQQSELPKQGLLAAIADPQLRRALREMHDDLAHPWTVETLATCSGMSRAAFAAKFRNKTGSTPLDYLTKQRIALARSLLREELPIAEIASRVGYDSQISFARAFGRIVGTSPGAFRRQALQAPATAAPITVP